MSNQNKDIDKIISSYKPPFKNTKNEVWDEMISKIESRSKPATYRIITLNRKFYYAAASLLIFLAITLFVTDKSHKTYYVENGAKQEIILPDNSIVLINSDSHFSYSKLTWSFKRKVKLDGEAYFKVKTGNEFIVTTPIAQVQVLGTEFNTYSREKLFETKCFSGKVQVKNKENEIVLTKGKALSIEVKNNKSNQFDFDHINNKDWRNDVFSFDKKSLEFVFDELSRVFDVEIVIIDNIHERKFTGHFEKESIKNALDVVCLSMQLNYRITNDKKVIIEE